MPSAARSEDAKTEHDFQIYKVLLTLWQSENPIKTLKLQVLLATNALLVAAVTVAGGLRAEHWLLYAAGAVFSLVWTFSIGRTCLFQDVWQARLAELRARYPHDERFSILQNEARTQPTRRMVRVLGGVPSRWYLLLTPLGLALGWLAMLLLTC